MTTDGIVTTETETDWDAVRVSLAFGCGPDCPDHHAGAALTRLQARMDEALQQASQVDDLAAEAKHLYAKLTKAETVLRFYATVPGPQHRARAYFENVGGSSEHS